MSDFHAPCDEVPDLVPRLLARIESDASTIATLRKALERYGRHKGDCALNTWCTTCSEYKDRANLRDHRLEVHVCTCGLVAALDEKEG